MGREIERKFLVEGDAWRAGSTGVYCCQGYLSSDIECTIRVRVIGEKAFLTVKGKTEGIMRREYEYAIPISDAREMLENLCKGLRVEKYRHQVRYKGVTWDVDEFVHENEGLVLAEVELQAADEHVELPDWLGREVSLDPRYLNVNLARHPYSRWAEPK